MTTTERLLRIFDDYIRTLRILTRGAPTRTERYSDGQGADQLHNCWRAISAMIWAKMEAH
jgi:hypothetical protein